MDHGYDATAPIRFTDRTTWRPGEWDNEPDKHQWTTRTGLPGLIVRNGAGALCGYAAVNPGHPWWGRDYDETGPIDVDIHGGLTYADKCQEDGKICHIPAPGEPDDVWWFGFDTAHYGDLMPTGDHTMWSMLNEVMEHIHGKHTADQPHAYRNWTYVTDQVEHLAKQLAAAS